MENIIVILIRIQKFHSRYNLKQEKASLFRMVNDNVFLKVIYVEKYESNTDGQGQLLKSEPKVDGGAVIKNNEMKSKRKEAEFCKKIDNEGEKKLLEQYKQKEKSKNDQNSSKKSLFKECDT
jgi:hypothetical protein